MVSQVFSDRELVAPNFPRLSELKTHNHLLGDRATLDEKWNSDGYWFFRDVLDKGVIGSIRDEYVAELQRQGVVDPVIDGSTEKSVRYNGASLANFDQRMERLRDREVWRLLAESDEINDFFRVLFEDEPFWVPITEYRATPPEKDRVGSRIHHIHQDGPYSPGIPFRICWVPLAEIDVDIGGMIIAEGVTERVNRHPRLANGTNTSIPLDAVPEDAWRHTTFQAGDVLLFNMWSPHTGLFNQSDRFRLSMDTRVMARGEKCPIIGKVVTISPDCVEVEDGEGRHVLRVEADTYVRNNDGEKLSDGEITDYFRPGSDVIVAFDDDKATVVRPTL